MKEHIWNPTPPVEQLPGEEWRPVPGFERLYSISSEARVYSWKNARLLTARKSSNGVVQVSLRRKNFTFSHLVLRAFVGPCPAGHYAAFKDGDPANCRLANLEWRSRAGLQREVMARRRKPRKPKPLPIAYDDTMFSDGSEKVAVS